MQGEQKYYLNHDYTISKQPPCQPFLASAIYTHSHLRYGSSYLWISCSNSLNPSEQHHATGFLQGYLTSQDTFSAFLNFSESILKHHTAIIQVQIFIDQQLDYIDRMVDANRGNRFWDTTGHFMEQLRFMYRGYLARMRDQGNWERYISWQQFYYLTNVGDIEDLGPKFCHKDRLKPEGDGETHARCNGYVKLHQQQLYVAHSTHNIYPFMLRCMKSYHLPPSKQYQHDIGSEMFTFSSRPGDLVSKDDFYILSSGLKVMETSFNNYNPDNYADIRPESLPCWLRTCVACRLARSGQEFCQLFLRERSGTHNNQWVIIDAQQLKHKEKCVMFIEQAFCMFQVLDMTAKLLTDGYIGSYNKPYSENISAKLCHSPDRNYHNDPRALIYKKYNSRISGAEDMKKWLILNEQEDPKVGLAPRYDLAAEKEGSSPFGLTDCKISTKETDEKNFVWVLWGPSRSGGRFQAFDWAKWPEVPHKGMPHKWEFDWHQFPIDRKLAQ